MNRCKLLLTISLAILLASVSFAGFDNTVGARGEGIGFSYGTLANEPFGALYNPATAAFGKMWQVQFQYLRPNKSNLAYQTDEQPYLGLFGAQYHRDNFGTIAFNALQFGSTSSPTKVVSTSNAALTYARLLSEGLAVGASGKYFYESNFSKRSAFDFDLGISYRSNANFALSASGENLLKGRLSPDWEGTTEHLSRKARLTGAYAMPMSNILGSISAGWQLTQAGEIETQSTSLMNIGSEWWFGTNSDITFAVRTGYTFGQATLNETKTDYSRVHAGASVNFNMAGRDLRLDYGFRTYPFDSGDDDAAEHSLSITYGFGGVPEYGKRHEAGDMAQAPRPQPSKPTPPAAQITPSAPPQPKVDEVEKPVILPPMAQVPVEVPTQTTPSPTAPTANLQAPEKPKPAIIQPPAEQPIAPTVVPDKPMADVSLKTETPKPELKTPLVAPQLPATPASKPIVETPIKPIDKQEPPPSPIIHEKIEPPLQAATPPPTKQPDVVTPVATAPQPETPKAPITPPAPILAQNTMEENLTESKPTPAVTPAGKQLTLSQDYLKLELGLEVSDISMAGETRIIFYLRPVRIIKLTTWKLYILKAKLKDWNAQSAESFAVHKIEGKGIPPINVIWNGQLAEGNMVASGKYFFVITGYDKFGQQYISDWCKFSIK